jgi:hypothetical protein
MPRWPMRSRCSMRIRCLPRYGRRSAWVPGPRISMTWPIRSAKRNRGSGSRGRADLAGADLGHQSGGRQARHPARGAVRAGRPARYGDLGTARYRDPAGRVARAEAGGATDAQIRRPLLYFGALYGLGGGLFAAMIISLGLVLVEGPLVGPGGQLRTAPRSGRVRRWLSARDSRHRGALGCWAVLAARSAWRLEIHNGRMPDSERGLGAATSLPEPDHPLAVSWCEC